MTPRGTSGVQRLHDDAGELAVPEPRAWPTPAPHIHSDLIGHCVPHVLLWTWAMGAPGGGPGLACGHMVFALTGLRPLNMTPLTPVVHRLRRPSQSSEAISQWWGRDLQQWAHSRPSTASAHCCAVPGPAEKHCG